MNKLRFFLAIAGLLLISETAFCQSKTVEKSFDSTSYEKLVILTEYGDEISLKSWSKKEISFEAKVTINNGKLNDLFTLEFEEENDQLIIKSGYDKKLLHKSRRSDCSNYNYTRIKISGEEEEYYFCSDIFYTVFVPEHMNVDVKTVSADIIARGLKADLNLQSVSGELDVDWDDNTGALFTMQTVSGEAFSDLSFKSESNDRQYMGLNMSAVIGDKKHNVTLQSVSGHIYVRRRD